MKISDFFKKVRWFFTLVDLTPEQIEKANKFREERIKKGQFYNDCNPSTGLPMFGGHDSSGNNYGSSN